MRKKEGGCRRRRSREDKINIRRRKIDLRKELRDQQIDVLPDEEEDAAAACAFAM